MGQIKWSECTLPSELLYRRIFLKLLHNQWESSVVGTYYLNRLDIGTTKRGPQYFVSLYDAVQRGTQRS